MAQDSDSSTTPDLNDTQSVKPVPVDRLESIPSDLGLVGLAHIEGTIDRINRRYFERAITGAREQEVDTLIVHIDTDGGEVFHARDMLRLALNQADEGPRLIAYVDFRAISAGALIAYGHDAIYIAETASIGDIGVIFTTREGEIKYAPEKIETVVRTMLTQAAETRGWSKGLLLKMTARNQVLYRASLADGSEQYVIEDDLPDFLSRHPDIDRYDKAQLIEYRGKDRLLTLTGREAIKLGMANGHAKDLSALYSKLNIEPASVIDLSPSTAERTAARASVIAPMLAGLALMFLMFELKTPGVGIWAASAAGFGALFLVAQYFLDLANNFEVVLMALGLVLIIIEALTLMGGGLLALLGAVTLFVGLALAFLPNEFDYDFNDDRFVDALAGAAMSSVFAIAIMAAGVVVFIYTLPRSRLAGKLALNAEVTATSGSNARSDNAIAPGNQGVAVDGLRPGGMVNFDGDLRSATGEYGAFIPKGSHVEVVGIKHGEAVVRKIDTPPTNSG